jgi:hypothetical protein
MAIETTLEPNTTEPNTTETRYCTNPKCTFTWTVEIDPDDIELQVCSGREPEVCETCRVDGYSVNLVGWGRWNLMKDGESVHIVTKCTVNKKPKIFVPYDHEYRCAHKDCSNSWFVYRDEPFPMMICGGGDEVCASCANAGFKIVSGIGDGNFYLYQNEVQVVVYSYEEAYKLNSGEMIKEPMQD